MLITLTSADSDSNSRFRCNFKESIRILPNSEVALINSSINRLKLIQITDKIYNQSGLKENVGRIKFKNTDDFTDVVIPVGDYSLEGLASELNTAFINISAGLGYTVSNNWTVIKLDDSDGDQSKLIYTWDWRGTQDAPVTLRPLWINTQTTQPAKYDVSDDPSVVPSGKVLKKDDAGNNYNVGLYGSQYLAEKNSKGIGSFIWGVASVAQQNQIGIGYAREEFIDGNDGIVGANWVQLIDWAIKINLDNSWAVWETPADDPASIDLNLFKYAGTDAIKADSKFRIDLAFDGTVSYWFLDSSGGDWSKEYTSTKKKTTPSDYSATNGLVPMMGLKTPYITGADPAGGGLIQTQVVAHDNSIDENIGGLNSGDLNTIISKTSNQKYTDFYNEDAKLNLTYVDATDNQFNIDGITPDINDPENLVEEFNTYFSGDYYEAYNSYRYKEIKTVLKNHISYYLYSVEVTIHDLDEWVAVSLDKGNSIYPLEKLKVWCNGVYVGDITALKGGGEHQEVTKTFDNIEPDHNGEIKVEIALGFKWLKGLTPDSSSQNGVRVESIKSYPTNHRVKRPNEIQPLQFYGGYNVNNIPDPLQSGAPAQKITFEPRQLGKYIGFFQNYYYSNSANSSNGSVGTQDGSWIGDMVEFNGVASRIMVDIENLPISNANSQTHSRSHTIANIPRFSQGGSNLGNIYYEASTPLYIKLKNPDEITINYLDVVLRDVNGIDIDKGILDTNSVVVINIK